MQIVFTIYQALWRRLFGGWLETVPLINQRWFQYVINLIFIILYLYYFDNQSFLKSLIVSLLINFLFWSKGHGAMYDLGHHETTEEIIKRYEKQWGYKTLCYFIPKKFWYTYWFDYTLMLVRYFIPSFIISCLVGWQFLFVSFIGVGLGYQIGWFLQDKGFKFFKNSFCNSATNWGEIIMGMSVGMLI